MSMSIEHAIAPENEEIMRTNSAKTDATQKIALI